MTTDVSFPLQVPRRLKAAVLMGLVFQLACIAAIGLVVITGDVTALTQLDTWARPVILAGGAGWLCGFLRGSRPVAGAWTSLQGLVLVVPLGYSTAILCGALSSWAIPSAYRPPWIELFLAPLAGLALAALAGVLRRDVQLSLPAKGANPTRAQKRRAQRQE